MKNFVAITLLLAGISTNAVGQTFLDRLQKSGTGEGKVTVSQTATIDKLVNGASVAPTPPTSNGTPATSSKAADKEPARATPDKREARADNTTTVDNSETTVDTRKKVLARSQKLVGYRVQAFAGGNTRADRQKAEQIGNRLKQRFPDVPVYVHFYSPRWICRMGNFRSYEEAHEALQAVKEMGLTQATVVRGKITVQY